MEILNSFKLFISPSIETESDVQETGRQILQGNECVILKPFRGKEIDQQK